MEIYYQTVIYYDLIVEKTGWNKKLYPMDEIIVGEHSWKPSASDEMGYLFSNREKFCKDED